MAGPDCSDISPPLCKRVVELASERDVSPRHADLPIEDHRRSRTVGDWVLSFRTRGRRSCRCSKAKDPASLGHKWIVTKMDLPRTGGPNIATARGHPR